MSEEWYITSLVVHSTPARVRCVADAIASIPGALIHGESDAGKLVVTLEASTGDDILSKVGAIQRTDGVLSAALVYQCSDSVDAMNEAMSDADH